MKASAWRGRRLGGIGASLTVIVALVELWQCNGGGNQPWHLG